MNDLYYAILFILAISLGWIISSSMTNTRWISAADNNGFIKYGQRLFTVKEIVVEEGEEDEEESSS